MLCPINRLDYFDHRFRTRELKRRKIIIIQIFLRFLSPFLNKTDLSSRIRGILDNRRRTVARLEMANEARAKGR